MFPSRSSNRSKIEIVDRPTSGCEPAAVCNCRRCNSSAYRQGNRVSLPGLRQQQQAAARRTLCRRDAMTWAGANVPYRVMLALTINTCSLAYQFHLGYQAVVAANTYGCCEVRMADRPSSKE